MIFEKSAGLNSLQQLLMEEVLGNFAEEFAIECEQDGKLPKTAIKEYVTYIKERLSKQRKLTKIGESTLSLICNFFETIEEQLKDGSGLDEYKKVARIVIKHSMNNISMLPGVE